MRLTKERHRRERKKSEEKEIKDPSRYALRGTHIYHICILCCELNKIKICEQPALYYHTLYKTCISIYLSLGNNPRSVVLVGWESIIFDPINVI